MNDKLTCPKCSTESDELYHDQLVEVWIRDAVIMLGDGKIVARVNEPQHQWLGRPRTVRKSHYLCKVCGNIFPQGDIDKEAMERAL